MTLAGASALASLLKRREDELANSMFVTGTLTSSTTKKVTVNVAGSTITCPYLKSYTPTVNDVVLLVGPPGQWFCLGTITH